LNIAHGLRHAKSAHRYFVVRVFCRIRSRRGNHHVHALSLLFSGQTVDIDFGAADRIGPIAVRNVNDLHEISTARKNGTNQRLTTLVPAAAHQRSG